MHVTQFGTLRSTGVDRSETNQVHSTVPEEAGREKVRSSVSHSA